MLSAIKYFTHKNTNLCKPYKRKNETKYLASLKLTLFNSVIESREKTA